jgi:hypothetical protein
VVDDDLRLRARRLLSGFRRADDLDRLFLDQRDRSHGRECFREVGDFIAHRQERTKGITAQIGRDVFTSADVWSLQFRDRKPSVKDIDRAARANLRLASDAQLECGCGLRRPAVKQLLKTALRKLERGQALMTQEATVLAYLGNRLVWKPVFSDDQLFADCRDVLLANQIVSPENSSEIEHVKVFLTLYAIALMHGSSIVHENGTKGELLAGFANRERRLEVKLQIVFDDAPKPIMVPVCMFITSLSPDEHCDDELLAKGSDVLPWKWREPIEVGPDGKLTTVK